MARKPDKGGAKSSEKSGSADSITDEMFRTMAALQGFDINGFDEWLAGMEECGAKLELTQRRQWAKDAIQYDSVNRDALLRHLEWMLLRWKYIRREEYILPLARAGDRVKKGGQKGGNASKATRRGKGSKRELILTAAAAYTGKAEAKVTTLQKRTGATATYIRRILKETKP